MASVRSGPAVAPGIPQGSASRLIAQANRSAPFGGRFGNPFLAGGGMSPEVQAAFAGDQARIARATGFAPPGLINLIGEGMQQGFLAPSITVTRRPQGPTEDELLQLLTGSGLSGGQALKQLRDLKNSPQGFGGLLPSLIPRR